MRLGVWSRVYDVARCAQAPSMWKGGRTIACSRCVVTVEYVGCLAGIPAKACGGDHDSRR